MRLGATTQTEVKQRENPRKTEWNPQQDDSEQPN